MNNQKTHIIIILVTIAIVIIITALGVSYINEHSVKEGETPTISGEGPKTKAAEDLEVLTENANRVQNLVGAVLNSKIIPAYNNQTITYYSIDSYSELTDGDRCDKYVADKTYQVEITMSYRKYNPGTVFIEGEQEGQDITNLTKYFVVTENNGEYILTSEYETCE